MRNKRPNYHNHMAAYSYAIYNAYQVKCTRINLEVIANTHSDNRGLSTINYGDRPCHFTWSIPYLPMLIINLCSRAPNCPFCFICLSLYR